MNAHSHITEVSAGNFQAEVVEKSRQVPVLLEFYAEGAEPSQQLAPVLRRLAEEYKGKFHLARIDIQQNPQLVQQLGVRTLPTIKIIFQGQMADNLEGPQEESRLRQIIDQLTMSPVERVREQLDALIAAGERASAIGLLQQLIQDEPGNRALQAELCDLLVMEGRLDEARQILSTLPADTEGLSRPKNRIEFLETAASLDSIDELNRRLEKDPEDHQTRLDLAIRLVADDQVETALEQLLELLKRDRQWQDEAARKTMIRVFDLLGKGNELATRYRRKMFTFLH